MSQGQDWNAPDAVPSYQQSYQQEGYPQEGYPQEGYPQEGYPEPAVDLAYPPAVPAFPQAVPAPMGAYGMPGMAATPVPAGFYYDQLSGLVLPDGTTLAPVGRRIGAFFLGGLLYLVTLGVGYLVWGLIAWSKGQTPAQQVLGMQTWRPQEKANATWGTMFLRGLVYAFLGIVPFAQLVSFFLFLSGKEHRALHDSAASTIVLHDPNKVLKPAQYQSAA